MLGLDGFLRVGVRVRGVVCDLFCDERIYRSCVVYGFGGVGDE